MFYKSYSFYCKIHTGKISTDYIINSKERRKCRAVRKKTLAVKGDELTRKVGGQFFYLYIDEFNDRWVFCTDEDLYNTYVQDGLQRIGHQEHSVRINETPSPHPAKLHPEI